MLHLGNVDFESGDADVTLCSNMDTLTLAAEMLGADKDELKTVLTTRELKMQKGQAPVTKGLSVMASKNARDSLSKAIFTRLFDWLVGCMNQTILEVGQRGGFGTGDESGEERFIGLVDLFGFEQFKINSFEQLCINFANERLQQFFLHYVFYTEEAIHKEEGVIWPNVELPDNQGALDLIAKKDTGVLFMLDAASKLQGAKETDYFESINKDHAKSRFFRKSKGLRLTEGFTVKHYAGDVTYHSGGYAMGDEAPVTWLDKNNYQLAPDQQRVMSTSKMPLLAELFEDPSKAEEAAAPVAADGKPTEEKKKVKVPQVRSAARHFITNLEELMTVLTATSVQFVRCVKPNMAQQPNLAQSKMVLNQLRCNGTMEAVEVMQKAFPSRIDYTMIHGRVVQYLPKFMQTMELSGFFEVIMETVEVPKDKYQLGRTKLFMKAGTGRALEELAEMDIDELVPMLTEKVKQWQTRKDARVKIGNRIKTYAERRKYNKWKATAIRLQKSFRHRENVKRFRAMIKVAIQVHRELVAAQKKEEEERIAREAELSKQQAELRLQQEAAAMQAAEEAAAAVAEAQAALENADEETAAKIREELAKKGEAAAKQAEELEEDMRKQEEQLQEAAMMMELEKMEAEQQSLNAAPGLELDLVASLMDDEPQGQTARKEWLEQKEREGENMGISRTVMKRVSMKVGAIKQEELQARLERDAKEAERRRQMVEQALNEEGGGRKKGGGDDSDSYSDYSDDDDDPEAMPKLGPDDKMFEVTIIRHETTGSLGLELDEYKGVPTVCAIVLGGPADQDGTLQMGDTVVSIDGKRTRNMDDVKKCVITAESSSLQLTVMRKPVLVLRRERAYMNMPGAATDSEDWEGFEVTLFSNRQLTFEKLTPPFFFGSIELPAAKSLRLMKLNYNVCLQIATSERSFEFYTDSLMTLYEWQRQLRSLMLSNTVSVQSGWLTLLSDEDMLLKRWSFDLSGSTHELCYYETDQCQSLNLPAQGVVDLSEITSVELIDDDELSQMVQKRRMASTSGDLREYVRLMCDVHRSNESEPIGLELNSEYVIFQFAEGSPAALASHSGGLQLGDRLLAIDGWEIDVAPKPAGPKGAKASKARDKQVKDLLRDLDAFPKPTHTFTIERHVPVVSQQAGAIRLTGKASKQWVMYPCSSDAVPLSRDEYKRALDSWVGSLRDATMDAKAMQEANDQENVLQQIWAELEEEDDWKSYYVVLSVRSGLRFYEDKADAAPEANVKPVHTVGLDQIRGAGRAPGIDFYDGIIEVELVAGAHIFDGGVQDMAGDTLRMRPQGSTALQNFLSAVNIYKCPPPVEELPPAPTGAATRQSTAAPNLTARGTQAGSRTTQAPALKSQKSMFNRKTVTSPAKGSTPRATGRNTKR